MKLTVMYNAICNGKLVLKDHRMWCWTGEEQYKNSVCINFIVVAKLAENTALTTLYKVVIANVAKIAYLLL